MKVQHQKALFLLFFLSGFCGLLYQIIWVRLAYASFGVVTPVLSVVISVFMLGLALGSYWGGESIAFLRKKFKQSPIVFYGLIEGIIGIGAFTAPELYKLGASQLLGLGELNSFSYLLVSALVITMATLPWCLCMGATFPFMMGYVEESSKVKESFSFLYLANVAGALTGTLMTSFVLIELLGFKSSLLVGAACNFLVAAIAISIGLNKGDTAASTNETDNSVGSEASEAKAAIEEAAKTSPTMAGNKWLYALLLFGTGFISMNMEVIWTRAYAPVLGNEVYSFSGLLFFYLLATFIGSFIYRADIKKTATKPIIHSIALLTIFSLLPVLVNDPSVHIFLSAILYALAPMVPVAAISSLPIEILTKIASISCTLISIVPFCLTLGYMTPQLIDTWSEGSPTVAGRAYAINILGCIIGPLFASYVLLPVFGPREALIALCIPLFIELALHHKNLSKPMQLVCLAFAVIALPLSIFLCIGYDEFTCRLHPKFEVRRDYAATVIACGEGHKRNLLVNGVGVTSLDQCTKTMAHLPLLLLKHKPEKALTICFGMGTTHRGLLTWDIDVTAVELVPSVRDSFGYFFTDAKEVLANPKGRVVIDDGRRYLRRTHEKYDVITIDPPPPTEAAGLSLLLSKDFFSLVKEHLKPGGILQEFIPYGENKLVQATMRSTIESFPYVRVFDAPGIGFHFMASDQPIEIPDIDTAVARLPEKAQKDEMEWLLEENDKPHDIKTTIAQILAREIPAEKLLNTDPSLKILDDRPINEYFLLRRAQALMDGSARLLTGKGEITPDQKY